MAIEAKYADDEQAPIGEDPPGELPTIVLGGVVKRISTLASLNQRYAILQTKGSASFYVSRADFLPIQDTDLKRRLAGEVVVIGEKDGMPFHGPAFPFWTGHADRHTYRRIAFTNRALRADTYNLYRGLGVTPKEGKCALILEHIRDVFASGDQAVADAIVELLAWQIQNIGKPSRIVVVMKTKKQQAGKGLILGDVMARIYGPSGFVPSTTDQVLGRFNDAIRGRSFIFLDEVLFAGDKRAADAVKSLSTCTEIGIETKGLPIVQCPIAINLWLASNHDNAAHIEEHDARYWVLDVSEHRVGDAAYFAALTAEIESGGREAFAHHLLNLDVSDFVPWRDIKKDNEAKRAMVRASINPFDARKWLEDCCHAERLIGHPDEAQWNEGAEYLSGALWRAYAEWQKSVRTPAGPTPTKSGNFGEVLTKAGFRLRHTNKGNVRVLPSSEACLEALCRAW